MSSGDSKSTMKFIIKQFLSAVPVKELYWDTLLAGMSWEEQAQLIKNTIQFKPNLTNPVKLSYQKAFVKTIIECLEANKIQIHDIVFEAYGRLVSQSDLQYCYKHFMSDTQELLSFKENVQIISEGTTGLSSWEAGVVLAQWCLNNKNVLADKTVLELGSGVGFTGISTAILCRPSKMYLTDCHNGVLENLCENVRLNLDQNKLLESSNLTDRTFDNSLLQRSVSFEHGSTTSIEVINLDWTQNNTDIAQRCSPHVVLAADVVYDCSVFVPLINTFRLFLKKPGCEVILACTERNAQTLQEFLNLLDQILQKSGTGEKNIPAGKSVCAENTLSDEDGVNEEVVANENMLEDEPAISSRHEDEPYFKDNSDDDFDLHDLVDEQQKEIEFMDYVEGKPTKNKAFQFANVVREIGRFVVFSYEGELYPGEIMGFNDNEVTINAMVKALKMWKWPITRDEMTYCWSDVLGGINKFPKEAFLQFLS